MAVVKPNDDEFFSSLSKFHDIIAYLYGPCARHVALKNIEGNVVRMVTSSSELFTHLQPKDDALKLLVNILRNHSLMYCDGGLFTGLLASNLIMKSHSEDIPHNIVQNINQKLLLCIERVIEKHKVHLNVGKLDDLFGIIKPILWSKLLLRENELTHLAIVFAKAFASSHQNNNINDVNIIVSSNNTVMDSSFHDGCLLHLGHYPELEIDLSNNLFDKKVLLLSTGLSLSSDDFIAEKGTHITVDSFDTFKDDVVFNQLINFCTKLISFGTIILCQKVVHPFIKSLFRDNNILCIDRIGSMMMPKLEKLCSCRQISNLLLSDIENYIGKIDHVETVTHNDKAYLKLISHSQNKCSTLVLCGKDENEGETLRNCYFTSMAVIKDVFLQPHVVYGGGCTETIISMELLNVLADNTNVIGSSLPYEYRKVIFVFIKSILDIASKIEQASSYFEHSIDRTHHHHWVNGVTSSTCCCGLIKRGDFQPLYFISFKELLMSNMSGSYHMNNSVPVQFVSGPFLSQSKNMYMSNIKTATQAAEIIMKIGYQVIER